MKTVSQIIAIIENRVRDFVKMKNASRHIDQTRKKAPVGWNGAAVTRQIRQAHR